ncbi:importin-4-like protein, partial [Plakobranchus ocellatus]
MLMRLHLRLEDSKLGSNCIVACQDQEEDDGEDEAEAEFDSMLIESAGDILPVIARIIGGQNFVGFFTHFVEDLLKRL